MDSTCAVNASENIHLILGSRR
ncbi:UNVERIFIED_CONTAM: hypothetical protein GTU68_003774 [Idotea baltica]|nr:hypothetical protein [Idotea baltica]